MKAITAQRTMGVHWTQMGRLEEARQLFEHSLRVHPASFSWHNLAVVLSQLGQHELANKARNEWNLAVQREQRDLGAARIGQHEYPVVWMEPAEFVARSVPETDLAAPRLGQVVPHPSQNQF